DRAGRGCQSGGDQDGRSDRGLPAGGDRDHGETAQLLIQHLVRPTRGPDQDPPFLALESWRRTSWFLVDLFSSLPSAQYSRWPPAAPRTPPTARTMLSRTHRLWVMSTDWEWTRPTAPCMPLPTWA